jgi:hypothetical protein
MRRAGEPDRWAAYARRPSEAKEMTPSRKDIIVFVALWIFLAFFWGVLISGIVSGDKAKFQRQTARVTGRLVDKEPSNHRLFRYEYVVDGQTHTGTRLLEQPSRPSYDAYHVGDAVLVAYEPGNPDNACACDPVEAARDEVGNPWLWAYITATVSALLLQFVIAPRMLAAAKTASSTAGPPN